MDGLQKIEGPSLWDLVMSSPRAEAELKAIIGEVHDVQRALMFWMPNVPADDDGERGERLRNDSFLLAGYEGPIEEDAETIGWVALVPNAPAKGLASAGPA